MEIGICFCVTADISKNVLQKCFWSNTLPTIWILSKSLILIGGHGNRKTKFSKKKKTFKNLLLRSHLAFIALHSGEHCGLWASGPLIIIRYPPYPLLWLLAHLSRRLKLEYLSIQLVNLDQILFVASLGWGKGCVRFWGRLDRNSGFHGNRKPPLTYNGENDVSTFSLLFLIRSFLYLQVTRTCIKSQTSLNFGQFGPLTMELAALERLKNFS